MEYVAAMDVGGTSITSALLPRTGRPLRARRHPTSREEGPTAVLQRVLGLADELVARGADAYGVPPLALGLASLGLVDSGAGTVVFAANVGWRDLPLRAMLADRLGLPVTVVHDVGAGGVAEGRLGAGRGCADFLFVAVGTGIGGAIVLDGRPYRGRRSTAGEIGHLVVRPEGHRCGCGGHGCLETVSSASAVARRYAERGGDPRASAADVCAAVGTDSRASAVWTEAVDGLADGLAAYAMLMDPDRIIVGGGLALAGEALFRPLRSAVARRSTLTRPPKVVRARLGDRAGLLGAGLLAWDHVGPETGQETAQRADHHGLVTHP